MRHPDIVSAGDAPDLSEVTVVALYDPADGSIHHLHQVFAFADAPAEEDDAVAAALHAAKRLGQDVGNWKVAVSHDPEHGRRPCVIDVATGAFHLVDRPAADEPYEDLGATLRG